MRRFLAGVLTVGLVSLGAVGTTAASATSTPSASLSALTADPTASTGAFGVPVAGIPGQAFHPQNASDSGPVQSIGIGRIGIGRIGIGRIGIGRIGIGRIGIGRIGLVDATLSGVLLSDLPISYPHACADANSATPCTGWSAVLAGTGLEFAPTQNVTLLQVLQNATSRARFETLELSDLDLTHTALANLPFASVALAGIPLSHLALDPSRGATALAQWCSVLAAPAIGRNCLTDFGINLANPQPSDDDVTLVTLGLAGVNFDALPLDEVAVAGNTVLGDSPLAVASIDDIDLNAAGIGRIGIGRIGIGRIGIGRIGIGSIGIGRIGLNETGTRQVDLDAAGIGRIGIGRIGIGRIGIGRIGIGRISLGSSAAGATGIGRIGMGNVDLAASGIGNISLGDLTNPGAVIACPTDTNVFDCSDVTKTLGDVPANLLRGTLWDLFQALVPNSASANAFANITIAAVVDALLQGSTEGDTITLTELVASLQVDSQTTIADLVANSTDAAAVELGTLLAGISADAQNGTTLGDLLTAIGNDPAVSATTVAQLLQVIANDLGITVEDLLIGLLGNQDLPWEQLDLGSVALQPYAQPLATPVNYTATLVVTDDDNNSVQDVVVTAKIPADFAYVAGSAAPLPDPEISDSPTGPVLTWTLTGRPAGTSSIAFQLRAGISEGSETVSGEAHLSGGNAGTPVSATTTVADTQASSNAANPAPMNADTLYLGHVDAQHTSNFFSLHIAAGQRASILLGNLPADEDLILYDATTVQHLRGTPSRSVIPVSDPPPSLTPAQQTLPPETLQDLPLVAGQRVYDVSAQRGFHDEQIDTGTLPAGDYLVQVASYNGSTSNLPYALRARVVSDANASCPRDDTAFANRFAFPNDSAPAFTAPGPTAAVDTVVLMNPTRLSKTFGAGAVQPMIDALVPFLSAYGKARLVRLDDSTDPEGIGAAYDTWDRDPCSVDAANAVVRAIGQRLDALVAANPSLRFVVLAGSDDQIPMGRLRDATRIANERGRASDFAVRNELTSSLASGFVLTDDVYAQQHPVAVGGRDLFVPDLRVGRLVERPDSIGKAFSDFTAASGVLPSSATSLATGYDFLKDGAQQVAAALAVGGHNPQTLINDTWTRTDLANALSQSPAIASINAHFDEQNILPAIGNADHSQSALFTVQDAEALPSLQGRLLFSMGCHSGLSLPNEVFGANADTKDWAEFMGSAGALWVANTGYGYGDTDTVALSEKLMSLLADQLDHSSSIGDALTVAKQRYAASLAVVSPYDEKALMESTFYGLPMWSLPSPTTPSSPLGRPGASTPSGFNPNVRVAPTNNSLNPTFVSSDNTQLDGHYELNGQTQVAPQRPIQPRFELDVSADPAVDPALNGLVAKGALVTSLTSKDIAGLKPDQFRPAIDNAASEQAAVVGDATFPAGIQAVTTYGPTQHLVLVPGQFRPTPGLATPGRGTERLFTKIGTSVYFGQPNDPDIFAPQILTSSAAVSGQSVTLTATVVDPAPSSGGVQRVTALVTQAGVGAGTWFAVELHPSASPNDPPNTWVGTFTGLPTAGNPVDSYTQAVDNSGHVASSSSKGAYFNAQNLASQGPLKFAFASTQPQGANGWWRDQVTVTITAPSITRTLLVSYSLDGGAQHTSPTPGIATLTIPAGSEGVHTLVASQPGQQSSTVQILMDKSAPVPAIGAPNPQNPIDENGPSQSAFGWYKDNPHLASIVPKDPNSFGSGVDTITYSASGAVSIATKTVDQPAVGSPPVTESLGNDGVTTFNVNAKDRAGNVAVSGLFPVGVDSVKPTATIAASPVQNAAGWHNSVPMLTITANDVARSSGITQVVYTVNGVETDVSGTAVAVGGNPTAGSTLVVPAFAVSEGRNVVKFQVSDAAGNDSQLYTVNVNVDLTNPNPSTDGVSPAENAAGWEKANTTVTFSGTDPDGPDGNAGSGIARMTYSAAKDPIKGGAVIASTNASGASTSIVLSTEGITTFSYRATDAAGNVEVPTRTRVVKLDKTAPTIALSLPATNANIPVGPQPVDPNPPGSGAAIPVYALAQTGVKVTYGCSDVLSGVATCTGKDGTTAKATGAALDTSTIGLHVFTVQSTDVAGNLSTKAYQYRVAYAICLKYDATQPKNIGSAVGMVIQLCNAVGANVSSSAITLTGIAANNNGALLSPNGPGGSNPTFTFKYDPTAKTYSYSLKTDSRFVKTPLKNWLNFKVSTDPVTTTGVATDTVYLNKLYRAYFMLK